MMQTSDRSGATTYAAFQLPGAVLLIAFGVLAIGGSLDFSIAKINFPIESVLRYVGYGFLGVLLFSEKVGDDWRKRFGVSISGVGLVVLLSIVASLLADRESPDGEGLVNAILALVLLTATAWSAYPLFFGRTASNSQKMTFAALGCFLFYYAWELISCASSTHVNASYYHFIKDRAFIFPLMICWIRISLSDDRFRSATGRIVVYAMIIVGLMAGVLFLIDFLGSASIRATLSSWNVIYADSGSHELRAGRRLVFPTQHFNRTAYWALISMAAMAASLLSGALEKRTRLILKVCLAISGAMIILSYTRGVLLSAGIGIAIWAFFDRRWKIAGAIILSAVIILMVMPDRARNHFASILRRETYMTGGEGPVNSIKARFYAWEWGVNEIQKHPLFGMGYGIQITEDNYEDFVKKHGSAALKAALQSTPMVHTHNIWLETGVQSGIPAVLALLLFIVLRLVLLLRAFRVSSGADRSRMAVWVGLEAALFLSNLLFYMLKKNFGFLFFYIWIWILLDAYGTIQKYRESVESK